MRSRGDPAKNTLNTRGVRGGTRETRTPSSCIFESSARTAQEHDPHSKRPINILLMNERNGPRPAADAEVGGVIVHSCRASACCDSTIFKLSRIGVSTARTKCNEDGVRVILYAVLETCKTHIKEYRAFRASRHTLCSPSAIAPNPRSFSANTGSPLIRRRTTG